MNSTPHLRGRWRWWLWWPMLAILAWLVAQEQSASGGDAIPESQPLREARAPGATRPQPTQEAQATSLEPIPRAQLLASRRAEHLPRDLFALHSWTPAPPAAPPPAAEQASAPPLPFRYVGKQWNGEDWEVYAVSGHQTYVLRAGAVLDDQYRVDRIAPPHVVLTYLPLGMEQNLSMGDTR